ncbi:MAG: DUF3662 domain-containing protein [Selenomonadaceae bacterium]|nr:DUF3662 domain-containing protein [Selenomonadaceae bacterium]
MGFSKIESAITGQLASLFQKRGSVEPSALIKALEREVVRQQQKTPEGLIVPNDYTILLSEEDCHRLSAARIIRALYETVERKIIRENCFMDGNLGVHIEKMFDGDDAIVVRSKYINDGKTDEDTIDLENDVLSKTLVEDAAVGENDQTIVADKKMPVTSMKTILPRQIEYDIAMLSVKDHEKLELVLGERQVYIGRRSSNDLVLDDDGASRVHAYVSYERHRHVIRDAGSLNGTFVNKKSIEKHVLRPGDKIMIGNSILVYEVL